MTITATISMISQTDLQPVSTGKWHPMFCPLGFYKGWTMTLDHIGEGKYSLEVVNNHSFTRVTSKPKTFTLDEKEQAIAYGKGIIDWDTSTIND